MALAASSSLASLASLSTGAEASVLDNAPLNVSTLRLFLLESEARSQASVQASLRESKARTNKRLDDLAESVSDLAESVLTLAENV